ncbi:MAG: DUF2147 domain-containing protein [Flavobacteriales bacterium]|nr:DUF2147 domain-containing protein [Flavobacteriales bacterium]
MKNQKPGMPLVAAVLMMLLFTSATNNHTSDYIKGTWLSEPGTSRIRIYSCGSKGDEFCGKIVWLKRNKETDGTPRVDKNNPDPKKRKRQLIDLVILTNFTFDAKKGEWTDGKIYDPYTGYLYSCVIRKQKNDLLVRGFVGTQFLGRTEKWTRVE